MITIDFVDDNYIRSIQPVIPTLPVVNNGLAGGFDVSYESSGSFYPDLLVVADDEQQTNQIYLPRDRYVVDTLNRIARTLTAWL